MNKFMKITLLMTLLLVSASALFALHHSVGIRYGLSYPITDQSGTDRIHPAYGLTWEAWLTQRFSLGLYPYVTTLEKVGDTERFKVGLIGSDVMLKYRFINKTGIDLYESTFAWLSPFASIGFGAAQYSTKGTLAGVAGEFDESKLMLAPTAAVGVSLITRLGVSVDLGVHYHYSLDDNLDMIDDGGGDSFIMPWLGFNMALGKQKSADDVIAPMPPARVVAPVVIPSPPPVRVAPVETPRPVAQVVAPVEVPKPVPEVVVPVEQPTPVTQTQTILRDRISMEQDFVLKGVQFEIGSANLTTQARTILMEVVEAMKANPDVKVEIQGHTDNSGGAAMNQKLSEDRAASVKTFLTTNGIAADRMTTVGHGFNKPMTSNDTVEGRTENRRIEFHIVK